MIRTGHTDNVLSFLGSSGNDVLKLRYFASGSNDGTSLCINTNGLICTEQRLRSRIVRESV